MDEKLSRRDLLQRSAAVSALAVLGAAACSKSPAALNCTDTTGLAAGDITVRNTLGYVDLSVEIRKAAAQYVADVGSGSFPNESESFR